MKQQQQNEHRRSPLKIIHNIQRSKCEQQKKNNLFAVVTLLLISYLFLKSVCESRVKHAALDADVD